MSAPYLIEFMGLVGNITGTMLSFIWPALFHLRIKGSQATEQERRFDKAVIMTGVTLMTIGLYFSSIELAVAVKYGQR